MRLILEVLLYIPAPKFIFVVSYFHWWHQHSLYYGKLCDRMFKWAIIFLNTNHTADFHNGLTINVTKPNFGSSPKVVKQHWPIFPLVDYRVSFTSGILLHFAQVFAQLGFLTPSLFDSTSMAHIFPNIYKIFAQKSNNEYQVEIDNF